MIQRKQFLLFAALFLFIGAKASDPISTNAGLQSVKVYRTGAELHHTATATLPKGTIELYIDQVSNQLDVNSIQVKTAKTVTVAGVSFLSNYLAHKTPSARVKMLTDSVERIQAAQTDLYVQINNLAELQSILQTNRDIKGTQTGMNVSELMKLMDYYKTKSLALYSEKSLLEAKTKKLAVLIDKINNQIAEEENKNTTSAGRLVLQLTVALAGKYDFAISYLTNNASWLPSYDVRVENTNSPLKLAYKAQVSQTTGIDWKQVKLSLSTALPNQFSNAPTLTPWLMDFERPVAMMYKSLAPMNATAMDVALESGVAGAPGATTRFIKKEATRLKPAYVLNGNIISEQEFAQLNPASIKSKQTLRSSDAVAKYGEQASAGAIEITLKSAVEDYVTVADNTLNVTFDVDMPYDVPGNGKEQTATLKTFDVAANYHHFAIPKLDEDVYLLAEVADWGKLNLLPGEANIIFEGTYVGKTTINPNSTLDTLSFTLGNDKRVTIKRDKLADFSSVKFLGSNKLQKLTYELTVKNNKKEAVRLQLKDQYPISTNKEIEIELLENDGAAINKETGELAWNLQLAPGESKKIRFGYSVKYPKDKPVRIQ